MTATTTAPVTPAEGAADAGARRWLNHPAAVAAAAVVPLTAGLAAAGPYLMPDDYSTPASAATGAALGLAIGVGLLTHRSLARKVGTLTAIAAIAAAVGIIFVAAAYAMPTCPGTLRADRCAPSDGGTWLLLGILSVLTVALFAGLPVLTWRLGRGVWRRVTAWRTGQRSSSAAAGSRRDIFDEPVDPVTAAARERKAAARRKARKVSARSRRGNRP